MQVMISQPMKGLSVEQIRKNRAEVVAMLEAEGHTVVDTVFTDTAPENVAQALWHLGKSLQAIASVDAVYFMDGWTDARGCRLEYEACLLYGIRPLNAGIDQLIPLTTFQLRNCENDKGISDNFVCDICKKPAQIIKRANINIQIGDRETISLASDRLEYLCHRHLEEGFSDTEQKYITLSQFAEHMSLYHSQDISSLSSKHKKFLQNVVRNFLNGIE